MLYGPKTTPIAIAISGAELQGARLGRAAPAHHAAQVGLVRAQRQARHREGHPARAGLAATFFTPIFYEVDLNRAIARLGAVALSSARPHGVAEGGILAPLVREVEVECLPLEIPDVIEVDVTALGHP